MIVEIAAILVAVVFAVLVGFLVPTLIQIRKTVAESEQLLARMNNELPSLLHEMRVMTENVSTLADQARDGVEHASVFLHAVGELGETVQQVHGAVRGTSGSLLVNLASVVAGFKAATAVVKERLHKEGGGPNGG
ncbi:MAG: DUF948 domain-containing protein [Nitrospirae bacterium]|nr:DUF948 domain-containing protein [Nitrospirota bacterium]